METGSVEVPVSFTCFWVSEAKWTCRSLDSSVLIMTVILGKLCKCFEKEDYLFSLTERVCIKYNTKMYIKEMPKMSYF